MRKRGSQFGSKVGLKVMPPGYIPMAKRIKPPVAPSVKPYVMTPSRFESLRNRIRKLRARRKEKTKPAG